MTTTFNIPVTMGLDLTQHRMILLCKSLSCCKFQEMGLITGVELLLTYKGTMDGYVCVFIRMRVTEIVSI